MSKPDAFSFMNPDAFAKFFDFGKFAELPKSVTDMKIPGLDIESLLAAHRRNFEALSEANQLAIEGMQAVVRRQAEIMRQSTDATRALIGEMMAAGTPEDKVAKNAELAKTAFEKVLGNFRELTEMMAKSNAEAVDVLSHRVSESLDEIRAAVKKHNSTVAGKR